MALLPAPPGATAHAQGLCGLARDAMAQRTIMRERGLLLTDCVVVRESDLQVLVQWAEYAIALHRAQERE